MMPEPGTGPIGGLDEPCASCGRSCGDHTVREWSACIATPVTDLPYEALPDDIPASLRRRFGLDEDTTVADTVVVKSLRLEGNTAGLPLSAPGLLHEFSIGLPNASPIPVAKILFLGSPESMRSYGRLVRDSANGAANAGARR